MEADFLGSRLKTGLRRAQMGQTRYLTSSNQAIPEINAMGTRLDCLGKFSIPFFRRNFFSFRTHSLTTQFAIFHRFYHDEMVNYRFATKKAQIEAWLIFKFTFIGALTFWSEKLDLTWLGFSTWLELTEPSEISSGRFSNYDETTNLQKTEIVILIKFLII